MHSQPFQSPQLLTLVPAAQSKESLGGMKEEHMEQIADFIDRALMDPENESNLESIKKEVNAFMQAFPLYG